MLKLKYLIAGIAIAMSSSLASAEETLKIGWSPEPYPPFVSVDSSGNWTGWEVEIANAICKAAGYNWEVVTVAWEGMIPALTSKRIDIIIGSMSITEERLKTVDFSDRYYKTPPGIVGRKGENFAATPEDLAGKYIGVQVSTIHQIYAREHFPDAAEIRIYQTQDEAYQDLAAGRIDATQVDSIAVIEFLKSDLGKSCCELKGYVADDPEILGSGVGIALRKNEPELKARLNDAIAKIRADGTYAAITEKYFDFDIYGE